MIRWTEQDEINFIWSIRDEDCLIKYALSMAKRDNWGGLKIDRIKGAMFERLIDAIERRGR